MKILTLNLEGFGPFRRRQTIDFTAFAEEGLFLIGGKTGAGKSSILDAITFALYANTPRYENSAKGVRSNFSTLTEATSVTLEFEHGDSHYRISRSPEYEVPKRRGEGTTIRKAEQEFSVLIDGSWQSTATNAREVAAQLGEIFPLSATEFLQVVMLAQNQFQKFLHADSKERQELLRKLFHTGRYKTVSELIAERAKVSGQAFDQLMTQLRAQASSLVARRALLSAFTEDSSSELEDTVEESVPDADITAEWLDAIVTLAEVEHDARARERGERSAAFERASKALQTATDSRNKQVRRNRAHQERKSHLEDADRLQREVISRLGADAEATPLVPLVDASQNSKSRLDAAITSAARAQATLVNELQAESEAGRSTPLVGMNPSTDEIRVASRSLTEQIGALRESEDIDVEISSKANELREISEDLEKNSVNLKTVLDRIAIRPDQRTELITALTTARERSQGTVEATDALEKAQVQLEAAKRMSACEIATLEAAERFADAATVAAAAVQHERELTNRRWLGAASHLARELVDGQPCSVCGGTEHPSPATSEVDTVSDEDLESAEQATSLAQQRSDAARTARDSAQRELERTQERSGGLDIDAATEKLRAAEATVECIRQATTSISSLEANIEKLDLAAESDANVKSTIEKERDELRQRHTALETELVVLRDRASSLRGEYTSVSQRLERIQAIERACSAALSADDVKVQAAAEHDRAQEQLSVALAKTSFSTAEEVSAAALSSTTRNALATERANHDKALHAAEETLRDPELADLPDELIDLEQPTAEHLLAQDHLETASQELGSVKRILDEIRSTVDDAKRTLLGLDRLGERARAERELASALTGQNERRQNLEAFVLAAYLEEVLAAANARLGAITSNRYELEHDDDLASHGRQSGLGLKIFDVYNGKSRQPKSLSGGETFLVSLALALGLADVVSSQAGGITLDTLFIDEGFGSLDSETLEIAMRTLDQLREGGRTIGVISHVGSMQERIPAHLNVTVSTDGSSDISTDNLAPTTQPKELAHTT